jgi:hypothetical protein
MTDCYCEPVVDRFGAVHQIEKCSSCELRDTLARPPPASEEAMARRAAFEARLREAAAREQAIRARVA